MKSLVLVVLLGMGHFFLAQGQKYYSKTGRIHFLSAAPLEKIESTNQNALVVLDVITGQMEWSVLIKGFQFEKALMQVHFNENYMESHKYPKGIFKGTITNLADIQWKRDGSYPVHVKGDLTLHGVTRPLTTSGNLAVRGGRMTATATFEIAVADFNIEIPKVVRENIAKTVKVTVNADLQPMN